MYCEKCKHYESFHHYPNPNAVARHYCTKCKEEIKCIQGMIWYPKGCYLNDYFEETEESKRERESRYDIYFCQIED